MDPFELAAAAILLVAIVIGILCCIAIKRGQTRWPFFALFLVPLTVLMIEFTAYPTNLEGVTSLTGVFTMMFCVAWVPYWLVMAIIGMWLAPPDPTQNEP